jgi:hypothetical protein
VLVTRCVTAGTKEGVRRRGTQNEKSSPTQKPSTSSHCLERWYCLLTDVHDFARGMTRIRGRPVQPELPPARRIEDEDGEILDVRPEVALVSPHLVTDPRTW